MLAIAFLQTMMALCLVRGSGFLLVSAITGMPISLLGLCGVETTWPLIFAYLETVPWLAGFLQSPALLGFCEKILYVATDGLNQAAFLAVFYSWVRLMLEDHVGLKDTIRFLMALTGDKQAKEMMEEKNTGAQRGEDTAMLDVCLSAMGLLNAKLQKIPPIEWQYCYKKEQDSTEYTEWSPLEPAILGRSAKRKQSIRTIKVAWRARDIPQDKPTFKATLMKHPTREKYKVVDEMLFAAAAAQLQPDADGMVKKSVKLQRIAARDRKLEEWERWVEEHGMRALSIIAPYAESLSSVLEVVGSLMLDVETRINEHADEMEILQAKQEAELEQQQALNPMVRLKTFKAPEMGAEERTLMILDTLQEPKWLQKVSKLPVAVRGWALVFAKCVLSPTKYQEPETFIVFALAEDVLGITIHKMADNTNIDGLYKHIISFARCYCSTFRQDLKILPQVMSKALKDFGRDVESLVEALTGYDPGMTSSERMLDFDEILSETADLWCQPQSSRKSQMIALCQRGEQMYKAPYRPVAKALTIGSKLLNVALDVDYTEQISVVVDDMVGDSEMQKVYLKQLVTAVASGLSEESLGGLAANATRQLESAAVAQHLEALDNQFQNATGVDTATMMSNAGSVMGKAADNISQYVEDFEVEEDFDVA